MGTLPGIGHHSLHEGEGEKKGYDAKLQRWACELLCQLMDADRASTDNTITRRIVDAGGLDALKIGLRGTMDQQALGGGAGGSSQELAAAERAARGALARLTAFQMRGATRKTGGRK